MSEILATLLCWVAALWFAGFAIAFIWLGYIQYKGGRIVRRVDNPIHYWSMIALILAASTTMFTVAVRRTFGI